MKMDKNSTLLMIGDSVTDCGRGRPVGQNGTLGDGYVSLVDALLQAVYPDYALRVLNTGISGNTVLDLESRWEQDVFAHTPDWVSIMIGINDVWRQFDNPTEPHIHVYLEEYEQTLRKLVEQTLPKVKGIVLMTPYYMCTTPEDPMRATMDVYGAVVKRIAEEHGTSFVDTQAAFDHISQYIYPASLSHGWDHVHPNTKGHMVLARAFLQGIGYDWSRSPIQS
ncbi:SGNH/GDSL hydrolase family protein [Paenibacillus dauci]|uniref:SGNH/GDSL hydrolase family protein n=1 Tax=Paenibacillus dauci TaxID=1567106 RepID=UPI000619760D|nr:SGNH/GDSL hydrolase family protein [Paenibacillus dauci]